MDIRAIRLTLNSLSLLSLLHAPFINEYLSQYYRQMCVFILLFTTELAFG